MTTTGRLLVLMIAGAFLTPHLTAQASERDDVHLRNECRLAAQVILTGHPEPHENWALGTMRLCDETGVPTLIVAWRRQTASAESLDLGALAAATRHFPTRTMFNAVAEVAESRTAPVDTRLTAISVLNSYVSNAGFSSRDLDDPTVGRRWVPVSVSDADFGDETSEVLGAKTEVVAILTRIRDQTSDARVRNAADQHLRLLKY